MDSEQLTTFMLDAVQHPWLVELTADLDRRRPRSMELIGQLRERSYASPILWPFHAVAQPVALTEASGSRVLDADGHEYLDMFLGFGTQALHGHNHPSVVERVRSELGRTVGNANFHPVEIELIDLLRQFTGHDGFSFFHTGTEATAAAVRLCRAHSGRRIVVKFESAVHGTHDWGVQSSVALMHGHPLIPWPQRTEKKVEAQPFVKGVAPSGDDILILAHLSERALDMLDLYRDEIACVIMESTNIAFPYADRCIPFVKQVAERARSLGLLFVLDEVQTGFRWGLGGVNVTHGINADLCTYGKVLSGLGIPLSAVGGRADVLSHGQTSGLNITDFGQKTTFMTTHQGNHLALLASLATLSAHGAKEGYYDRVRARVAALQAKMAQLRAEGIPLHLAGYGDFIGTFLFVDRPERARDGRELAELANPAATLALALALRREGIYTYSWPFVFMGDAYSDEDVDRIGDTVMAVAREMRDAGYPLHLPWG